VVASVTQFDSAETVQVQSRVVDTAIEPLPPLGGNGADGAFVTATLHFAADGAVTDVDALLQLAADRSAQTAAVIQCVRLRFRSSTSAGWLMHAPRQRLGVAHGRARPVRVK